MSRTPSDEAVTPLPRPLTTPPLTMTYFITGAMLTCLNSPGDAGVASTPPSLLIATSTRPLPATITRPGFQANECAIRGEMAAPDADCISIAISSSGGW